MEGVKEGEGVAVGRRVLVTVGTAFTVGVAVVEDVDVGGKVGGEVFVVSGMVGLEHAATKNADSRIG